MNKTRTILNEFLDVMYKASLDKPYKTNEDIFKRQINPVTGCYCDFAHRMNGDGCDICNPEFAEELRKENENETDEN